MPDNPDGSPDVLPDVLQASAVVIGRLADLDADGRAFDALKAGIDRVFWATAARRPADANTARDFKALWLDQYFEHEPDLVFVAATTAQPVESADIVGYLVGCRIDPATTQRFAALTYFQDFARYTAAYPAHLHLNLDAAWRGQRIGERLVEALCLRLARESAAGVHVVTGQAQRNVGFYRRLGFRELARAPRGVGQLLFMARALANSLAMPQP